MSLKPGLGKGWFDKYHSDVFPRDEVIINGKKVRPPRYYDSQYEILYPDEMDEVREQRVIKALKTLDDNTPERLYVRETVQKSKLSRLVKTL